MLKLPNGSHAVSEEDTDFPHYVMINRIMENVQSESVSNSSNSGLFDCELATRIFTSCK